jgi:hypothetical protein
MHVDFRSATDWKQQFINSNNLDGVDFDWEYPREANIPGIPPGSPPADSTEYDWSANLVHNRAGIVWVAERVSYCRNQQCGRLHCVHDLRSTWAMGL